MISTLISTIGVAGIGSVLKIVAGLLSSWQQAKADAKRLDTELEIAREQSRTSLQIQREQAVFGDSVAGAFNRWTRRGIAWMLVGTMCYIAWYSVRFPADVLTTISEPASPDVHSLLWGLVSWGGNEEPRTVDVTLGHIVILFTHMCFMCVGFYFTPDVSKR